MTSLRAGITLVPMDAITGIGSMPPAQSTANADSSIDLVMLKKSQDLAKDNASRLLELLPPPRSPNTAGTGGKIDLMA